MKPVNTADKSLTFHSLKYGETYHSVSGAIEESFEKFVKPCKVRDGMMILDVCFGIGYNSLAALATADVKIVALENDIEILHQIQNVNVPEDYQGILLKEKYELIKELSQNIKGDDRSNNDSYDYNVVEHEKIRLIVGDALDTIAHLPASIFDAVFLDPFSPKKCPELWTASFFKQIYRVMKPNSILATYSCARLVRDNLKEAGFQVRDGPSIGRKAPSTIAVKLEL